MGTPLPGIEIRTTDTGELLVKGDTVFTGYYKNPEATAKSLKDGWFHSGDAAVVDDDGQVIIIDRMADVMKLADGSKFSPQLIENKLKFSPFIMDAVVIGQDRPYITAMISIDSGNVGKWAENRQIAYTTFADLSQKRGGLRPDRRRGRPKPTKPCPGWPGCSGLCCSTRSSTPTTRS